MHTDLPFQEASVATLCDDRAIAQAALNEHPVFGGVRMQDLVTGADTQGRLSCHLVHIAPGCRLDTHEHPAQTELHQVVCGGGLCVLRERTVAYRPGEMAIIPQGERHSVTAGDLGLTLVATFSPPLK